MAQALELLGVADQAAGAADVDLALLGDRLAVANRAMVGEGIGRARLIAGQILDHLRDDVAGALDDDAVARPHAEAADLVRSEEHTSELQSLMRISYAVFCLKKQKTNPRVANT